MTASLYDSPAWRGVFHDPDLFPLFSDTAELRANLLVMGTLAQTQAKAGLVPDLSAEAIYRAAMEVQIDPAALSAMIAETGDPIPALVAEFQKEMKAPEHAKWVHWESDPALTGATGLSLRLRQSLKILGKRLNVETPAMSAYHSDPTLRAGIATGLGLSDAGDATPVETIRSLAQWVMDQAKTTTKDSLVSAAIRHQLQHLNTTIQTAPPDVAPMINTMTLPQMVLGLGRLTA